MAARSNYDFVRQVMQSTPVRRMISQVADRKAAQAAGIASAAGVAVPIQREDGTRPKGRPYARISLPASHEHGDSKTRRLRILGQVVQR